MRSCVYCFLSQLEEKSAAPVPRAANGVNTLVPKRKAASSMPPRQAVNILHPVQKKSDKKRIAPVLLSSTSAAVSTPVLSRATNAASKENNIRNILGPTVSPTVSDAHLLDARMTGALVNSGPVREEEVRATSERDAASIPEKVVAAPPVPVAAASGKIESKKPSEPSLKRKRDGERPTPAIPSAQTTAASKSREVAPRQPKLLNSRYPFHISLLANACAIG